MQSVLLKINMIHDLGSRDNHKRNRSDVTLLDRLKSCCYTAQEICVLRQMMHGRNWNSIASQNTLIMLLMDVLFVWYPFLLSELCEQRNWKIAWHVQFIMNYYCLTALKSLLTSWSIPACVFNFHFNKLLHVSLATILNDTLL